MRAGNHTLKRSFLWLGSASAVARLVDLAAIAVVITLIAPAQIGEAALAWTVITSCEPFASLGLSQGLLSVRRVDKLGLDSALCMSLFGGVACALGVVLFAPVFARLVHAEQVAPLLSVASLKLIPVALIAVPQQRLARALRHRDIAAASVLATLLSAGLRVLFALAGLGAWAFVLSQIAYSAALFGGLWARAPMRLRLRVDEQRTRELVALGLPSTLGVALTQWARNVDYLFVGAFLGMAPLGLYRVAFDLAMEPMAATGDVVARSATPTLQKLARVPRELARSFRYAVALSLGTALPIAALVFALAPQLLATIKDPSFATAASATRLLVVAALMRVVVGLYTPLAMAIGRPGLALRTGAEQLVVLSGSLLLCMGWLGPQLGISAAALAWCVAMALMLGTTAVRFRFALRVAPAPAGLRSSVVPAEAHALG